MGHFLRICQITNLQKHTVFKTLFGYYLEYAGIIKNSKKNLFSVNFFPKTCEENCTRSF